MGLPVVGRSRAIDELAREPDRLAEPYTFVIREVTGLKRTITLTSWCLPTRPVPLTQRQRMKITYYPGATEATAQVFGPHHTDGIFKGVFLARYMGEEGARCFVLTSDGREEVVLTPERARAIFTDICRSGQELIVEWGVGDYRVIQRGICRAVTFHEHAPQRIEWEAEFEWIADTEQRARLSLPPVPPDERGLLDRLRDLRDAVLAVEEDLSEAYAEYIDSTIRQIDSLIRDVEGIGLKALELAGKPAHMARAIAQVAANVLQAVVDIQAGAIGLVASYREAGRAFASLGHGNLAFLPLSSSAGGKAFVDHSAGAQADAAAKSAALHAAVRKARYEAVEIRERAKAWIEPDYIALHEVCDGESLRRIAVRYYGTADRWQDIANANDLTSDILTAGMVLLIPR